MIEFIDLKAQQALLKEQIDAGIQRVLAHGQYILGSEVSELKNIGWVNPDSDPNAALAWLAAGCPEDKSRLIKSV